MADRHTLRRLAGKLMSGALGAGLLALCSTVNASIIVHAGNFEGSGDVDNVVSNPCSGNSPGPDTTISGCLNTDHAFLVSFTSSDPLVYAAGGQSRIEGADDGFHTVTISVPDGWTFSKLQLNIMAAADGHVTFTGDPNGTGEEFELSGNGENRFTILGERLTSVSFQTTVGVDDLRQVRIGGLERIQPTEVPTPGALGLLGLGLIGLGIGRKLRFE
jgi:hypothetical protein